MGFLGMRGTGDWIHNERPLNWRETILKLYPTGSAPLTAILSKLSSSKVDDPTFNWWTQQMSPVSGPVTARSFTGAAANGATGTITVGPNPNVSTVGDMPETVLGGVTSPGRDFSADMKNFVRIGHQVLLGVTSTPSYAINAIVTNISTATPPVITVKLLEAAPAVNAIDLSDCDYFKVIGNVNEEGANIPAPIALDPVQVYNYTQIFRSPLSMTRTARLTHLRDGDYYQRTKAEALEMHSWEIEQAFLFGKKSINLGTGGKPQRTTDGFVNFIKTYAPGNVFNFTADASVPAAAPWSVQTNNISNGQRWLDSCFEKVFRYGANEKLMLCGSGALLGINQLAQVGSMMRVVPGERTYGLRVTEWITPFGSVNIITHPLMSIDPILRNTALLMEPREMEYKFITDTTFYGEKGTTSGEGRSANRMDGIIEEFLTEAGLMFGLPQKCAVLYNVGVDKAAVTP